MRRSLRRIRGSRPPGPPPAATGGAGTAVYAAPPRPQRPAGSPGGRGCVRGVRPNTIAPSSPSFVTARSSSAAAAAGSGVARVARPPNRPGWARMVSARTSLVAVCNATASARSRLCTPGVESLLDVEAGLIHRREAPAVQFGEAPGRFSLGRRHDGQVLPGSAAQRFSWRPNSVIPLAIRLPGRSHRPRLQTGYLRVEQVRGEQVLDPPPSGLYLHSRYARKQRQWRWRCVTGAADRRGRDRRLCPCQLRAGELCAVRGKAPVLICSGAASRQDCLMGVQLGFMGVQLAGKVIGAGLRAAAAVRGLVSSSGRLSLCFPDDEASCCGCRGPALRAARSRLTAFVVSAGHMPGPVGQAGAAASCRLRNAGPADPCRATLGW